MKKWMLVLLSSIYLLGSGISYIHATDNSSFTVTVNNQIIDLDVDPINDHGTLLVPIRFVVDQLGGKVISWRNNELILSKDTTTITLHIGSTTVQRDQENFTLTTAPQLIGGRTFVPLRFLTEAFGASINYAQNNVSIGTSTTSEQSTAISGNSIGNLNNRGLYVGYEDWIIFNNHADGGKIYKEKIDGTQTHKIADEYGDHLNIVNQKLYYTSGYQLIKSNLDGTHRELIKDLGIGGPRLMTVSGEWLYY